MMIQGIPIQFAADLIVRYIAEKKGVLVPIQLPILPQHEEKFIQALNVACNYYNIQI